MLVIIAAILVFAVTTALAIVTFFAEAMNDITGDRGAPLALSIFGFGCVISGLLLASHWIG